VVVKVARLRALSRLRRLDPGVTVVVVNWNTREVLADVVQAVRTCSPPEVRILVVDNGSTDGSRELIRSWRDVDHLLLPSNVGHGLALDLATFCVRTDVALVLDSDAIPLGAGWLEPAVGPVRSGQAVLAGLRARRDYVHPVYLAVHVPEFVRRRLSFQVHRPRISEGSETRWGENAWDTAELLTPRLSPGEVRFVERTPNPVAELPGMVVGGVVYHHGGVTREAEGSVSPRALTEWRDACHRLGLDTLVRQGRAQER
jgi:hypothetical protein